MMLAARLGAFRRNQIFYEVYRTQHVKRSVNLADPIFKKYLNFVMLENEDLLMKDKRNSTETRRLFELKPIAGVLTQKIFLEQNIKSTKEIIKHEQDEEMRDMMQQELQIYQTRLNDLDMQLENVLLQPYLSNSVILLQIVANEGDEAAVLVEDLFDLYKSYCKYKNWTMNVASVEKSKVGLNYISLMIEGTGALEFMNLENGLHQRIAHDQENCKSTAVVTVLLEPAKNEIDVNSSEIRKEVINGDQGDFVSLTHTPTGTTVKYQEQTLNESNGEIALRKLTTLIFHSHKPQNHAKPNITNMNVIRTYDFMKNLVFDNREVSRHQHRLRSFMRGGELLEEVQEALLCNQRYHALMDDIKKFAKDDDKNKHSGTIAADNKEDENAHENKPTAEGDTSDKNEQIDVKKGM